MSMATWIEGRADPQLKERLEGSDLRACHERREERETGRQDSSMRCCTLDERVVPSPTLWGNVLNQRMLRWLKTS